MNQSERERGGIMSTCVRTYTKYFGHGGVIRFTISKRQDVMRRIWVLRYETVKMMNCFFSCEEVGFMKNCI